MKFSEREGFIPVRKALQVDTVDVALRNGLWNMLYLAYWCPATKSPLAILGILGYPKLSDLFDKLWHFYFKWPIDTVDTRQNKVVERLKRYFFECQWV